MNKFIYLFVFCLFFVFGLARAQLLKYDEFELENGLAVVVNENHKAPVVKTMLFYKVGAADETAGKSGLAHLLEHLMFRGTTNVSGTKFNDLMLENGIDNNAYTSRDVTCYHAFSDISRLDLVLFLEADRMANLKIDDEAFLSEQKIVFEERRQRVENTSKARFAEEANKIFYNQTPYEHPVSGTLAEINALTKEDALDFYNTYYTPQNAVLVVSGDITAANLKPMVEKYFGNIKKQSKPKRNMFFKISENGEYYIKKQMDDVEKTNISVSYIIPSISENKKHVFALQIFSNYFGENGVSYLKKHLIDEHKAVSAGSSLSAFSRGSGEFEVFLLPLENTTIEENLSLIENAIKEASMSLSDEIVEREKQKILSWFVYIEDNPASAASFIGHLKVLGWSNDDIKNYVSNIKEVTVDDIHQALDDMLKSRKMTAVLQTKEGKRDE